MIYNKIAIIGPRGAGKTSVSNLFGNIFDLPVYHVDKLMWGEDWEDVEKEKYLKEHNNIIIQDNWVIEGYIDQDMINRLVLADLVIYLDYSVFVYKIRHLKRYALRYLSKFFRNGMENPEENFFSFILKEIIIIFTNSEKKEIEKLLRIAAPVNLYRIRSDEELHDYLSGYINKILDKNTYV